MKKWIFLGSVIVLLLIGFSVIQAGKFHIVSTNPKLSAINNYDSSVDITFNKPLVASGISVSSSPEIGVSYKVIGTSKLRLTWSVGLVAGSRYTITLKSITASDHETIRNHTLSFKVASSPFNKLSPSQRQSITNTQDNYVPSDAVYTILPHYSLHYELTAQPNGSNKPNIIFIYLPTYQDIQQGATAKQSAISDAKTWLTQNGITLSDYTLIDHDTQQPIN